MFSGSFCIFRMLVALATTRMVHICTKSLSDNVVHVICTLVHLASYISLHRLCSGACAMHVTSTALLVLA